MVTFRSNNSNNNRRPPFRSNNNRRPPFRSNNEGSKFSNNNSFQRKVPSRNNHNAAKLIEKYTEMAREALSQEDRVLSENYLQHADHFTRVQNEQEGLRVARVNASTATTADIKSVDSEKKVEEKVKIDVETVKKEVVEPEVKKIIKSVDKKVAEKKAVAS
tara:strand:+ start:151 stop:633 length:483 start_codon:yes stop_codon:yes gene_type:complete